MSTRNSDINLIVRARAEGQQAISSLADVVSRLGENAVGGGQDLAELGRSVIALDKAASGLSSAQDKVAGSASKQAAAIHDATAGIAEQQERVETLRRGLGILAAEADKAFVGPKRSGLTDLIRLAKSELSDAESQLRRYTASYDRNLTALRASRSGLLDLRATTVQAAEAQTTAAAAVELNTQALNDQTAAARRAAAAQQFYNNKGGPQPAATANGATTDALLEHFQRLQVEAGKTRAAIDPLGDAVERYQQRIAAVRGAGLNGLIGSNDAITRERQLHVELQQTLESIGYVNRAEQDRIAKGADGLRTLIDQENELDRVRQRAISRDEQAQAYRLDANDPRRVSVSDEQIQKAKELAASLFDAQHARELLQAKLEEARRTAADSRTLTYTSFR
jgi:hypothetical protein